MYIEHNLKPGLHFGPVGLYGCTLTFSGSNGLPALDQALALLALTKVRVYGCRMVVRQGEVNTPMVHRKLLMLMLFPFLTNVRIIPGKI